MSDIYTNTYKTLSYLSSNYDFHIIVFLQPTRGHYSLKKNCWIKRNNGTSTFYFTEVKNEQKNWKRLDLFLDQDSSQYNFDQFSKIYIFKY